MLCGGEKKIEQILNKMPMAAVLTCLLVLCDRLCSISCGYHPWSSSLSPSLLTSITHSLASSIS